MFYLKQYAYCVLYLSKAISNRKYYIKILKHRQLTKMLVLVILKIKIIIVLSTEINALFKIVTFLAFQ